MLVGIRGSGQVVTPMQPNISRLPCLQTVEAAQKSRGIVKGEPHLTCTLYSTARINLFPSTRVMSSSSFTVVLLTCFNLLEVDQVVSECTDLLKPLFDGVFALIELSEAKGLENLKIGGFFLQHSFPPKPIICTRD